MSKEITGDDLFHGDKAIATPVVATKEEKPTTVKPRISISDSICVSCEG